MENLRSARCSPFVISKALAARMRKLINARARKNKCTARMLANARKDHSLPLIGGKSSIIVGWASEKEKSKKGRKGVRKLKGLLCTKSRIETRRVSIVFSF